MDENEYKATYASVNDRPCIFGKAILRRCADCSRARRLHIAEREAVACQSPSAQERCALFHERLQEKSLFALHITHTDGQLPHGKEMKVECGGLLGLQGALEDSDAVALQVSDVHALLDQALAQFHDLAALPYGEIVKSVVHYAYRRPHSTRRDT
jgi:hypothetical protein